MANISQFHGEVSKCSCGLADNPTRENMRACNLCYGRGFRAKCKICDGKGQTTVAVNGGDKSLGTMTSTCSPCGGTGGYAVNRPADWVDVKPEVKELAAAV